MSAGQPMAMDQELDQLAAAEGGIANAAASGHKTDISNALSSSPALGEDMQRMVCPDSKHSFAK